MTKTGSVRWSRDGDIGGIVVTLVMLALLLRRAIANLKELAIAEPPNVVKE